jgi:hypothetical protein
VLDRFIPRMPFPRLLLTTTLCAVLGAIAGRQTRPVVMETVVAASTKPVISPTQAAASFQAKPPPFTSSTASMEWVRAQMEKGDTTAAERLFHKDAGLTDDQRLSLAKELVSNFRRQHPRVLARILMSLPRGEASDRLLWSFLSQWCAQDADDALHFIEALPTDRLNSMGVLHQAAFGLATLPAERVAAFAARLDYEGRSYLAEGLVAYADQIGSWRNTTAILSKLNAQPRKESLSSGWPLATHLAELDPQAIESQIAAEADPGRRADMLCGYAWITGLRDPPRGLELDAQIQNQGVREEQVGNHVERWLQSERAAALSWLHSDAARQLMNSEQRTKLLNHYPKEAAP